MATLTKQQGKALEAMQKFADEFHTLGIGSATRQTLQIQMGISNGSELNAAAHNVKQVMKAEKQSLFHYDFRNGQPYYVGSFAQRESKRPSYFTGSYD